MKYFTLKTVVSAYKANSETTKNKFWGLLSILSSIDSTVETGTSYDFNTSKVSELLENLFCLDDEKKSYSGAATWNIMLSKKWTEKVAEQMLGNTPNIYDVLVWYFRTKAFNEDISDTELVKLFLESVHISVDDAKKIFDFRSKKLEFASSLYAEKDLYSELGITGKCITAESSSVVAHPGELARAPFIQTLYAGQSTMECLIITPFKFSELYGSQGAHKSKVENSDQTIFYGCPGTGKSFEVKRIAEGKDGVDIIWYEPATKDNKECRKIDYVPTEEQKKKLANNIFRTTFHPDYDYATFVGCYKPGKNDEGKLDYRFIPQVFTNAYVSALRHPEDPTYLIIEEINRGNCAQIFGDLFQLLDRTNGVSDYEIKPDAELARYLSGEGVPSESLKLPANLRIYATMNTSDQSLFPMDSAFKRRWAMEYKSIDYEQEDAKKFKITIGNKVYLWIEFLQMVNEMIVGATTSEDKQMGEFFIKGDIGVKEFTNKVMFYLWNDVCKDLYNPRRVMATYFLRVKNKLEDEKNDYFTFAELFSEKNKDNRLLHEFMLYLEDKYKEDHKEFKLTVTEKDS